MGLFDFMTVVQGETINKSIGADGRVQRKIIHPASLQRPLLNLLEDTKQTRE